MGSILERTGRRALLRQGAAAAGLGAAAVVARPSAALAADVDTGAPGTFSAPQTFAPLTDDVPVTVQAASGQTAPLQRWTRADGSVLARMSAEGRLGLGGIDVRQAAPGLLGIDGDVIVEGAVKVRRRDDPGNAPEVHLEGLNGRWYLGIDVYNSPAADFFVGKRVDAGVNDFVYISHNGTGVPTTGVGVTPPDRRHMLQVSGSDRESMMGGLSVRVPRTSGANAFVVKDSAGVDQVVIDSAYFLSALRVKARAADNRALILGNPTKAAQYGFYYAGNAVAFRYFTGGVDAFAVGTDGRFKSVLPANLTAGGQLPHVGNGTPSGGVSGEIRVGAGGRVWANDGGVWKSTKRAT
ncbi:MAG TPA: hypothetical protein VF533_04535 [Solirubrobacteraceae bacterium]|jgi:hypothetical protein